MEKEKKWHKPFPIFSILGDACVICASLYSERWNCAVNYATTIFVGNAAVSVVDNAGCVNLLYLIEKCCNADLQIPSAHASVLKKYGLIDHANGVDDCIKKIVLNFVKKKTVW